MTGHHGKLSKFAALCVLLLGLSACAATFRNHGYVPDDRDLEALTVGVDTRDTVAAAVGRPTASGVLQGDAWYFVQSRVRNFAYRAPETIERELVAISFSENGTISNIERFGLEDGRVVSLSRRVTESSIREFGIVQQLLRNFGNINIGDALADET